MVVAVKVYKKQTPNGKLTVYLGKRDFVDHLDYCDPVDGVLVIDPEYLKGRGVFGQLITTYRYGREEDEVSFCLYITVFVPNSKTFRSR